MRRIVVLLIALLAAPLSATPSLSEVEAYRALIAQDLRLAITGYRLAQANSPFCPSKERNPGWVIHDVAQYPDMHAARTAFGFDRPVQIAAIFKGGAADQAGLSEGDAFIGLDDATLYWPAMPVGKTGYERMASFKQLLNEKWGEKPQMPMQISRAGHLFNTVMKPPLVCASDFQVDTRDGLDAGADGQIVRITYAMMEYVRNDDELAAVVAHEFSHNILGHRKRLNKQG
ncbi:MAG: M48 family metalloprotease, partial [Sphingorhabdus sp.]